jgi:hypothetical protein
MISTKVLLRTGFYKVWRPADGIFTSINDMLCENQYNQVNYVSTIVHLEEALECFQTRRLEGRESNDFSMLEGLEIKVIRFSCSKLNEESEYLEYDNLSERKCYDESVHGNVKLTIDSEHFCRTNANKLGKLYLIEIVDMDDYSIARLLLTSKQYAIFPQLDWNSTSSPIYLNGNRLFCLKYNENYEGKNVKYATEIMVDKDHSDICSYWDACIISTINHEGHKRFRCKRVLDRTLNVCLSLSKEDSLAGIILWMLINKQFDLYNKFSDATKRRLFAIHKREQTEKSSCKVNIHSKHSSDWNICDVESESGSSRSDSIISSDSNTDTELNAVCDYIAHSFYSSSSTVDIISLQYALDKCAIDTCGSPPTKSEIKACLVLMLKWMKDPLLLHKDVDRRIILLKMIPCEEFLTSKYQSLGICSDIMCPHENYIICPEVERILYGYILFSLKRWLNEDTH